MPLFPNHGFQKPDLSVFEFLNWHSLYTRSTSIYAVVSC